MQSRRQALLITAEGEPESGPLLEAVDAVWGHLLTEKQQLSVQQVYGDMRLNGGDTPKFSIGRVSPSREQCSKWPGRAAAEAAASLGAIANPSGHVGRM